MGFRYRKSLRLARGMRLNLTRHGLSSFSAGRPGSTLNFGRNGVRGTVGIPGSGLSYSSRLSSGSAMLPGLIIAILTGIVVFAARGNRLAQVVLVVMAGGAALLVLTREPPGPVASILLTDTPRSVENQRPTPVQLVGRALENSASREQPSKTNAADGTRVQPSESSTASSKLKNPKDAQTTNLERVPPGSGTPAPSHEGTSIGQGSRASLLNLANTADALRAQLRLTSLGYRVGRPDGVWGLQSEFALNQFRREHKLNTVAQWDEETQATLFSEAHNQPGSDLEVGQRGR
jgi:hypothetical protein